MVDLCLHHSVLPKYLTLVFATCPGLGYSSRQALLSVYTIQYLNGTWASDILRPQKPY